jgi:hydrogenase nickel incorporation protein HypB
MQTPPERKTPLVDERTAPHFHAHLNHSHEHGDRDSIHAHHHHTHTVSVHTPLLERNQLLAERTRGFLRGKGLGAVNIVSSPGSGKTTLIARTLDLLNGRLPAAVIVGDLETANDAERLRDKGAPVVQVTTGNVCHLDAQMVARGLEQLDLDGRRLLIIENVGNLVCPAAYDLGEDIRIVLFSVTEGEDKPLKYPPVFRSANLVVISKIDLAAPAEFDLESARRNIGAVAPDAEILELSARTGDGMDEWISRLEAITPEMRVLTED